MRFLFDDFVLDASAGELRRDDLSIEIRPKVYALLAFLIEHRGRLITKDELLDKVWRDVHVSDGSLNRTVAELRHALGDDSRQPRFVETVARRGYRFIGSVTELPASNPDRLSQYQLLFPDRVVSLREGENILGRTPECDVQVIAASVSRRHARIVVTAEGAAIEDLGSMNGTFVREKRIAELTPVDHGDDIRLGKERLRLITDRNVRARTEPAL